MRTRHGLAAGALGVFGLLAGCPSSGTSSPDSGADSAIAIDASSLRDTSFDAGRSSNDGGLDAGDDDVGSMDARTIDAAANDAADAPANDAFVPPTDACNRVALAHHSPPANLVVVFTQSNSMSQPFGASGPKWQVTRDAILAAFAPIASSLEVGAIFFPTIPTGNTCSLVDPISNPPQIPIEPGASFATDLAAHFASPGWTLMLGTPLVLALTRTDAALPDPSTLVGRRAVVLVSDGAPTCDTVSADVVAPVHDMYARGIRTYVVGLPGSAAASALLTQIASAGGTTSFIAPADPSALQAAFARAASETVDPCTLLLDAPMTDTTHLHLLVTDAAHPGGNEIARGDATNGWSLAADDTTVTLIGSVCASATAGDFTSLQFVEGCPALP